MGALILQSLAFLVLLFAVSREAKKASGSGDCKSAMNLVKTYLETSKVELIKNIREAKAQKCKAQAWRKVDSGRVVSHHGNGCTHVLKNDGSQGLTIEVKVTPNKCSKGESHFDIYFKGNWTQIMYTQRFLGHSRCWTIFGMQGNKHGKKKGGLEQLSLSMGDIIFGQVKMRSKSENMYDGKNSRCDDNDDNFWHRKNGLGERKATVILRRSPNAQHAGISTFTSCDPAIYILQDIYVLE